MPVTRSRVARVFSAVGRGDGRCGLRAILVSTDRRVKTIHARIVRPYDVSVA